MSAIIAYQNKDITSKLFAEQFKGKSLKVYGINVPSIKQVLPTNIPIISANEMKIDNVFLLEDDSIAIVDYESVYKRENKHKYIRYINYIAEYYSNEWGRNVIIHMIIIYTADVERFRTSDAFEVGCLTLSTESAYLSEVDSKEVLTRLTYKVDNQLPLTEEELMEFIILPLSYKGNEEKNISIRNAIDMTTKMTDDNIKLFLLSGIAVFTDKVIRQEYADEIRRMIRMTKVGQLFEEEKINFANEQKIALLVDMINKTIITEEEAAASLDCDVVEFRKRKEAMLK